MTTIITSKYTGPSSSKAVAFTVRGVVAVVPLKVAMVAMEVAMVVVEHSPFLFNNRMSVDRVNPRAFRLDNTAGGALMDRVTSRLDNRAGWVLMNRMNFRAYRLDNMAGRVRSVCIPSVSHTSN